MSAILKSGLCESRKNNSGIGSGIGIKRKGEIRKIKLPAANKKAGIFAGRNVECKRKGIPDIGNKTLIVPKNITIRIGAGTIFNHMSIRVYGKTGLININTIGDVAGDPYGGAVPVDGVGAKTP